MLGDLHIHSNFSDGSNSVEEIIAMAQAKNLDVISLVDHDTVDTYNYISTIDTGPLKIIRGIEISAYDYKRNRKVHILGYGYQTTDHIKSITDPILDQVHARSLAQLKKIQEAGYIIEESQILPSVNKKATLYRQQIVYAMVKEPYESKAYQGLYQKLFKNGGPAHLADISYVSAQEAVQKILADGGLAVMAHPGELDSYDLVADLVDLGLGGIEAYHPSHSQEDIKRALDLAQRYKLLVTGGSDYHGDYYKIKDLARLTYNRQLLRKLKVK